MSSIDIKAAYYSVPIEEESQKFSNFYTRVYYTNFILFQMIFLIHSENLQSLNAPYHTCADYILARYIDAVINVGYHFSDCLKDVVETANLLNKLGFVVYHKKSKFFTIPRDDFIRLFIGF